MAITFKNQHDSNNGVDEDKFSNDEIEVANILLDLPFLMTKSLSNYRFDYSWASKKPRSVLNSPPSPPPCTRRKTPPPPPLPLLGVKREAASPNTPLSFSPSDSDSKSKKKPRLFLRKEELEQAVKERLHTQQQLKESIEKVEVYLKSLIAENSKLKARKHELEVNVGEKKWEEGLKLRTTACTSEQEEETSSTTVNDQIQVHAVASYHLTPLIQPQCQFQCVNDSVYAGPPSSNFKHQASGKDHHHHHHHHEAEVVVGGNNDDPVCAGQNQLAKPIINYHNQPLISDDHDYPVSHPHRHQHQHHHHQQFDLNLSPDEAQRKMRKKARENRMRINKEKKTRVRP